MLAHPGQVDLRITAKTATQADADRLIAPVEQEVRSLLGGHVFATDDQTMPIVVGELLASREWTVASYEGLTGGMVAQHLQEATGDRFLQGTIGRQPAVMQSILSFAGYEGTVDDLVNNGVALTDQLAAGIRCQTGADVALAVHSVPDSQASNENLRAGRTFMSVASDGGFSRREYNFAGPGMPDRTRATLHALDLLRMTMLQNR